MSLSYDEVAELLAQQVLGDAQPDNKDLALRAMDLSLDKVQQHTNLIAQEKSASFTSTGALDYEWTKSPISLASMFRAVKFYTAYGSLEIISHQEFVTRYPDYRSSGTGIPSIAVQWGKDNLLIWPDQSGETIYFTYYALLDRGKADRVLSVLYDVARHYLENDPQTRALNWGIARESMRDADRANDRSVGTPLTFLPEDRVARLYAWKRRRRT